MKTVLLSLADFRNIFGLTLENMADLIGYYDKQTVGKASQGKISCLKWKISADYSSTIVNEVLNLIDKDLVEYVYRKYINQKSDGRTKVELVKQLLSQALSYDKEYQINNPDMVISVKSKQEFQYTSDLYFEQWIQSKFMSSAKSSGAECHSTPSLYAALENFVINALAKKDDIVSVNLAFNQGLRWIFNDERRKLLEEIIERAQHINIIITEPDVSDIFTKHQRESRTFEISNIIAPLQIWNKFILNYSSPKIILKKSPVPILRHYISFHYANEQESIMYIGTYTYGRGSLDKNQFSIISSSENYYNSYYNEFDYLWRISTDVIEGET